ncbi:hypothetical protein FAES_3636 [Fibrella aestuarina BUZ 2]|uniref:Uncharacterized protein n=1 Tax=Fibrella aestuarina BUZ 2 TaxID=1166018 RepID=I0KBZ0_9BACT|nr:DUF6712 family protein [Fibrella aestuarina]CCH01643.1 hypothetical protein FAES_3636 [Fibrella aestuarina BUZ 2]
MPLLFNATSEIRLIVPVLANDIAFSSLAAKVRVAQAFVERYVGTPLMNMVSSSPSQHAELAELMRVPVANLTVMKQAASGVGQVTDTGVLRSVSTDQKDAFEWQHDKLIAALQAEAWDGLEALLRYLEINLSSFPEYAQSAMYQADQTYLIRSAEVFDHYYYIAGSRLTFASLQPSLRTAEKDRIRPLLGDRHAQLLASPLSPELVDLQDEARRALVYATLALALRERAVDVTEQGIQVRGISEFSARTYASPADKERLSNTLDHFDLQAEKGLNKIAKLMRPAASGGTRNRVTGNAVVGF